MSGRVHAGSRDRTGKCLVGDARVPVMEQAIFEFLRDDALSVVFCFGDDLRGSIRNDLRGK